MGKRRKKKMIAIIFMCSVAIGSFIFVFEKIGTKTYNEIIKSKWNIDLPIEKRSIYEFSQDSSLGDGIKYHVLKYNNDDKLDQYLQFNNDTAINVENHINKILDSIYVPKDEKPDFKEDYKYYCKQKDDSSIIYLLYMPKRNEMYVVEDIY